VDEEEREDDSNCAPSITARISSQAPVMSRRLTILVQAYACNPVKGSEEGVGWGWIRAISEDHDLHVLTAEYHRKDIEARLEQEPELCDRLQFHFVPPRRCHYRPTPRWIAIENSPLKPIMNMAYRLWQRDAFKLAQSLMASINFDIVHVITYVGFRFPGAYWKLPLPLVWGPIGGLENTPWRYFPALGWWGGFTFAGRNILNTLDKFLLPGPKRAFQKAEGGVISATSSIKEEIRKWYGVESVVRCEIGIVPRLSAGQTSRREAGQPLRIIWSGLHIHRKALPLLLDVLAELPEDISWRLTVLGAGPLTDSWKNIASEKDIADKIDWTGRVSREEAIKVTARSHVMVITSVYDLTSSVLVEALSMGVPVISPDHYGFSDAIDDSCGIGVNVSSLSTIREGVGQALVRLYHDEPFRRQLAIGALARAERFHWSKTRDLVSRIYQSKID
jgi:glycosyltransferase involved in cell wall biosynthesis